MKKKAEEIKKGDKIIIGGEELIVQNVESSDIGKQGTKKCRIEARKGDGEIVIIIRPADYPFSCT
ncbi:hypothetical protein AUJ84_02000 [Candidatus Pacearchaeota archaeon CG1_02_32_132]|nr:MAG: hypothetical protein AUJ84_02000 [Candidatus Pacearchaeota archaeon CG1_02_32_132]